MVGLTILILTLGLAPRGALSALASTWTSCQCRWDDWKPWSDCTSTCFGQRVRTRSVWTICDEFNDCATNDEGSQYEDCNTVCHNGGTPSGLYWAPCTCTPAYYENCCTTRIDCGTPDSISNGNVIFSSTYYDDVTTYVCDPGYNITGGDVSRTCQSNRAWTGQKPSCVYAEHCTSNPCENGATCVDLLGDYSCVCTSGWSGQNCENDVQPPIVQNCPSSIHVNATDITVSFNWTEPTFFDPMGKDLDITKNYNEPEFVFPWGDFTIQYVALKPSNGLSTECNFQIHVRPTPCEELNVPLNGARLCNNWQTDYGRFCLVTCQDSYTIDLGLTYRTWYVCGASGSWIAPGPVPDCNVEIYSSDDVIDYQPEYVDHSFTSSCNDNVTITSLQTLYIQRIQEDGSFVDFCQAYPDECNISNVDIKCA